MSHTLLGHTRWTGEFWRWWRVLTKCGPLEKEMANHYSIIALRTPWTLSKGKNIQHWKINSPGQKVPNMLLEKSGEIAQEGMKRLNQSGNNAQLWMCLVVKVVWCCKEQYCIGTWNVRSTNQGKLEVVKQQMARVNINILGISELKWMGMGEFNSDAHYTYYCGQESLRRNGVALIVNRRVWNDRNDLSLFLRQNTQFHSNPSMPQLIMTKKLKLNGSMKTYKTF